MVQEGFYSLSHEVVYERLRLETRFPDIVTVGKLMGNGHLGGRDTIAAGGDRGVRQSHPLFQHLWRQPGVLRWPMRF
jgi:hypothetical protein